MLTGEVIRNSQIEASGLKRVIDSGTERVSYTTIMFL